MSCLVHKISENVRKKLIKARGDVLKCLFRQICSVHGLRGPKKHANIHVWGAEIREYFLKSDSKQWIDPQNIWQLIVAALLRTFYHFHVCSNNKHFLLLEFTRPACSPQTSWTVFPHISSCKCQCPHTSGSFFLNIKQNNDDVLVYVSPSREFSKMAISFIMSRVCFCCGAVVKIVSASSGGCMKKHTHTHSAAADLFPE